VASSQTSGDRIERCHARLPEEGALADWPVASLLHALHADKVSGVLGLHQELVEKRVYVLEGRPVYVDSDLRSETLGAYLRRTGTLTEEQHRKLVEQMHATRRRQGELLIEAGILSPHELFQALTEHMAEKIVSCIAWEEGTFTFLESSGFAGHIVTFPMATARIVIDGIRRHFDLVRIAADLALPDHARPYLRETPAYVATDLQLTTREARIMSLVRKGVALKQLVAAAGGDHADVMKTVYALYLLELVGFDLSPATDEPGESTADERAEATRAVSKGASSDDILVEYLKLKDADYFTLLDLPRDASAEKVDAALADKERRYGPPESGQRSTLAQQKAGELLAKVADARRVLGDPEKRKTYTAELDARTAATESVPKGLESESLFRAAQEALDRDEPDLAVAKLREALSHKPGEPQYEAWLGWALYCADPKKNRKRAEAHLARARNDQPGMAEPHKFMARMCELEGQDGRAQELYQMAVERAPEDTELAQEARLFAVRRRQKTKKKPGSAQPEPSGMMSQDLGSIFRKIFGKSD